MKKLILILTMLLPAMAWAGSSGALFVNNKNGVKDSNPANNKIFYYQGRVFRTYQMEGDANCYYYMDDATKTKYLFMENAKIRYIQGTKSMTDLVIVLKGTNYVTTGDHTCIGLEKGNLTIDSADGELASLLVTQNGSYRCIFTTQGTVNFGYAAVNCVTANTKKACISSEGSNGQMTFNDTFFTCRYKDDTQENGERRAWIYAAGGVKTTHCGFPSYDGASFGYDPTTGYLKRNGQRYYNTKVIPFKNGDYFLLDTKSSYITSIVEPKATFPPGYSLGKAQYYHTGRDFSASFTIEGKSRRCYQVESPLGCRIDGAVYFCPELNVFVLGNGSRINNFYKWPTFEIPSTANLTVYVVGSAQVIGAKGQAVAFTSQRNLTIEGLPTKAWPKAKLTLRHHDWSKYYVPRVTDTEVFFQFRDQLQLLGLTIELPYDYFMTSSSNSGGHIILNATVLDTQDDAAPTLSSVKKIDTWLCGLPSTYDDHTFRSLGNAQRWDGKFRITKSAYKELHLNLNF